jgi:alkylation response protein AidB-like acyl-CoA dehydrogenase
MRIELDDELERFRDCLRAHIAAHRPPIPRLPGTRSPRTAGMAAFKRWCASLYAAGYLGYDWPEDWGGTGRADPLKDFIVDHELADADVPRPVGAFNLVARALLEFGREEQRGYYLPRIRDFADMWCQLFSEPEAGSDLAALRTRARLDGDSWVVDGQKVWTTHGHIADLGFLLARTEPEAQKHAGISAFIVDMRSPGVTVRPLREVTGASDFNEVFLDSVRIPAGNIIGARGQGWQIARTALAYERAGSLREDSVVDSSLRLVEQLSSRGGAHCAEPDAVRRLGELAARARATDLLGLRGVIRAAEGAAEGAAGAVNAAVMKVVFSETNLALATLGVELQGADGIVAAPDSRRDDGHWQEAFLWARGFTISAGSNEIMRNLIAENGLGLPREPRPAATEARR